MKKATPSHEDLLKILKHQEEVAIFSEFSEDDAFELGKVIHAVASADKAPVVIDIRTPDRTLFHVALPGSAPDNDHWARRKSNLTLRSHQSSLRVGETLAMKGRDVGPGIGLDPLEYAAHGGSFPVRVKSVGVVAAITVSGLASADDHRMIIAGLSTFLNVNFPQF